MDLNQLATLPLPDEEDGVHVHHGKRNRDVETEEEQKEETKKSSPKPSSVVAKLPATGRKRAKKSTANAEAPPATLHKFADLVENEDLVALFEDPFLKPKVNPLVIGGGHGAHRTKAGIHQTEMMMLMALCTHYSQQDGSGLTLALMGGAASFARKLAIHDASRDHLKVQLGRHIDVPDMAALGRYRRIVFDLYCLVSGPPSTEDLGVRVVEGGEKLLLTVNRNNSRPNETIDFLARCIMANQLDAVDQMLRLVSFREKDDRVPGATFEGTERLFNAAVAFQCKNVDTTKAMSPMLKLVLRYVPCGSSQRKLWIALQHRHVHLIKHLIREEDADIRAFSGRFLFSCVKEALTIRDLDILKVLQDEVGLDVEAMHLGRNIVAWATKMEKPAPLIKGLQALILAAEAKA